ncbi:MAG: hypothetical protein AAFY88_17205 [Acidobacteriota bacterium]
MDRPDSDGPFPGRGLGVQTYVVEEHGRWVVYLDVAVEQRPGQGEPAGTATADGAAFEVVRNRIRDYSTEDEARVAARFISLGASRELSTPPSGF